MSSTDELLTILEEQCKWWNRNGTRGLLYQLDTAQKLLMCAPHNQNVYCTGGVLPALATTTGTFDYNLPSNCYLLKYVLIRVNTIGSTGVTSIAGMDYGWNRVNSMPPEYISFGGVEYVHIPYIRSWQSGDTATARLMFTVDPGTTTDYYRLMYYKKPADLTSDSIPIEIPPPWDMTYLLPAVIKLIEGVDHGNVIESRASIIRDLQPALWRELDKGEQGEEIFPVSRGF
jgi:hypothetical protein